MSPMTRNVDMYTDCIPSVLYLYLGSQRLFTVFIYRGKQSVIHQSSRRSNIQSTGRFLRTVDIYDPTSCAQVVLEMS